MNMVTMAQSESYESPTERKFTRYLASVSKILGSPIDIFSSDAEVAEACFTDGYTAAEAASEIIAQGE